MCVFVKIKVKSTRSILLQKQLGRRIEIIRDCVIINFKLLFFFIYLSIFFINERIKCLKAKRIYVFMYKTHIYIY